MSLLNGSSVNKTVLNGAVGASVFTQAVTASSTSSSALVRAARVIRSVTSSSAVSKLVLAGKLITYLSTSATSVKKAITRAASAVSSTSTATVLKQAIKPLTSTASTSTASLVRSAKKIAAITSTSTVSYLRALTKTISFSSTSVATAIKAVVKTAFSTSSTTTNTLVRTTNKPLSVVSTSTSSLVRAVAHILSVLSTTTNSLTKSIRKTVSVASATTNTLLKQATKTFSVVSTFASSLIKKVLMICITLGNKYVITGGVNGLALNQIPINSDSPVYTTTTGVTSQATIYVNSFYYKVLTYLQSTTSTITRIYSLLRTISALSTVVPSIVRSTTTTLTATVSQTATLVKRALLILITFGTKYTNIGAVGNVIGNSLTLNADNPLYTSTAGIVSTATVSVNTLFYRTLSVLQSTANSITTASSRLITLVVTAVTSTVRVVKGVSKTVSAVVSNAASVVKKALLTLITYGVKYTNIGAVGNVLVNGLALNADNPLYTATAGITTTATVGVQTLYYRTLSAVQSVLATIAAANTKLATLVASVVTSTNRLIKNVATTQFVVVSNVVSIVKRVLMTLITFGVKYTNIGAVGNVLVNGLSLNSDNPLYTSTAGIATTATVNTITFYRRTLAALQSAVSSLSIASIYFRNLVSSVVLSVNTVVKNIDKPLAVAVSTVTTAVKNIYKELITFGVKHTNIGAVGNVLVNSLSLNSDNPLYTATAGITTTATLSTLSIYRRTLAALSNVAATLSAFWLTYKILTASIVISVAVILSNVQISLSYLVTSVSSYTRFVTRFVLLVTTAYTSVVAYAAYIFVSFQDTLMVRARKISARKLADFISIRVSPKKTNITVVDQDDLNG